MQQFFIEGIVTDKVYFSEAQSYQLCQVLRASVNDVVRVVDKNSKLYLVKLISLKDQVIGEVIETLISDLSDISIDLYPALIKKDKWEWLLQKAVEFGVSRIIPLITDNCVVKLEDKVDKKISRWNSITLEACEQSQRIELVEVLNPVTIKQLTTIKADLKVVAYEKASSDQHLIHILKANDFKSIALVFGPEGGFKPSEISTLKEAGFIEASLGSRILRAESASIYALSVIDTFLWSKS